MAGFWDWCSTGLDQIYIHSTSAVQFTKWHNTTYLDFSWHLRLTKYFQPLISESVLSGLCWIIEVAQTAYCRQASVNTRGCCGSHNLFRYRATLPALQEQGQIHCSALCKFVKTKQKASGVIIRQLQLMFCQLSLCADLESVKNTQVI